MKLGFLFLASVAAVCAQNAARCRCGAFITLENNEAMIFEMPEIPIDSCDDHNKCKNVCNKEVNEYSDLWAMTLDGITVGQIICENMAAIKYDFVHNQYVYGYYEVCGGPWEYTGISSTGMLCCNDGLQEHCIN